MKSLILHIGRDQTDTAQLQNWLTSNQEGLAKKGILYPETGRKKVIEKIAHHDLSFALKAQRADKLEELKSSLQKEAEEFDTIIISSEDLQNIRQVGAVRDFFENYDITVICYLKEYLGTITRAYSRRIQFSSHSGDFLSFAQQHSLNLRNFMTRWEQAFDNVIFKLHQPDRLRSADITSDFADSVGIDATGLKNAGFAENHLISGNLLALKILMNNLGMKSALTHKELEAAAALHPRFRGRIFIADETTERLRNSGSYNRCLRETFGNLAEESYTTGNKIFDPSFWQQDMSLLAEHGYLEKLAGHPIMQSIAHATSMEIAAQ